MSLSFQRPRILVLFALALSAALAPGVARGQSKSAKSNKAAKEQPPAAAAPAAEKLDYGALLKDLQWRELGPAIMGGRIDDFAVVESNPSTVYVGTASGGVWKTTNAGTTWEPVFDNEGVSTIGDVTVAPSDPAIVWVGTGEPNNRQSSSWGNGVYESTDAGKTWANMGLRDSHHIGRIAIHPANPSVVYVAALGHLYSPNKERGVYKTTDGGKTWKQTLFVDDTTGAIDIDINPKDPNELYAAMWSRSRSAWRFRESGPTSGIYKSNDGGETWKKISGNGSGFMKGEKIGRIGVAVYPSNPSIVYAIVDNNMIKPDTGTKKEDTFYHRKDFKDISEDAFLQLDQKKLDS